MEVVPDGVIDEPLLRFRLAARLVLEHHVVVPPPLHLEAWVLLARQKQRVPSYHLRRRLRSAHARALPNSGGSKFSQ